MDILHANITHIDLLTPLFDAYRQFYQQASDLVGARAFLKERLIHQQSILFLALDHHVGLGFCQLYPVYSSVSMQKLWLLNDLYVQPTYRKKKIGYALLCEAKSFALQTHSKGLMLQTAKDNTQARALYENFGFTIDKDLVYNLTL